MERALQRKDVYVPAMVWLVSRRLATLPSRS